MKKIVDKFLGKGYTQIRRAWRLKEAGRCVSCGKDHEDKRLSRQQGLKMVKRSVCLKCTERIVANKLYPKKGSK